MPRDFRPCCHNGREVCGWLLPVFMLVRMAMLVGVRVGMEMGDVRCKHREISEGGKERELMEMKRHRLNEISHSRCQKNGEIRAHAHVNATAGSRICLKRLQQRECLKQSMVLKREPEWWIFSPLFAHRQSTACWGANW